VALIFDDREQVDGPATHVLLVGVGELPHCGANAPLGTLARSIRPLSAPPCSAHALASWMLEHRERFDRPLATVRLLTDPVDESPHLCTPPDVEAARDALKTWMEDGGEDDAMVLFWSGHGLLEQNTDARLLLCRDVGNDGHFDDYMLDLKADRRNARAYPPKTHLWLIDACQESAAVTGLANLGGRTALRNAMTSTLASVRGQDFGTLFSSVDFQLARSKPGQPSYFCEALLEALRWRANGNDGSGPWTIRTTDLVRPINDHLAEHQRLQRCRPADGVGQHTLFRLDEAPRVPVELSCAPSVEQPKVTMRLGVFDNGAVTVRHEQPAPTAEPWALTVDAGNYYLGGEHPDKGERMEQISVSPMRRKGVLRW